MAMTTPDREGWWAFEGVDLGPERSPKSKLNGLFPCDVRSAAQVFMDAPSGVRIDGRMLPLARLQGKWWKITMPWETEE